MGRIDFSTSLQQLDGEDWGESMGPTRLVMECHRLRRVPIDQLTGDNLRMLISQRIGLEYLVPRALELLTDDPLLEEDYRLYPGDLLWVLLVRPHAFWTEHDEWRDKLRSIAVAARARCDEINAQAEADWHKMPSVVPEVVEAIDRFLAKCGSNRDRAVD
jgi:hypothetical protein